MIDSASRHPRVPVRALVPIAITAVALAGCAEKSRSEKLLAENQRLTEENVLLSTQKEELTDQLQGAARADEEATMTLNEVQRGLEEIRVKEFKALNQAIDVGGEGKAPVAARERLTRELTTIRMAIQANLRKLEAMEEQRKANGQRLKALQAFADELKRSLEEKATLVAALETRVADLTGTVSAQAASLTEKDGAIREKDEALAQKTRELNTGWVAVAGKKALLRGGVIDKRGSILGLGGAWQETGRLDPELFREVDTSREAELEIPAPLSKVRLLPGHPEGSYEVVAGGPALTRLRVTDRDAFWRESRTLVVMIPD